MSSPKSVGLVLGCGASRGWAHIGVIEALREANIPIDFIAGCSVGAYVGALYACGKIDSLKEFLLLMNGKKIFSYFDVVLPRSGLLDGSKRLKELFSMHTSIETFEELAIPLVMVATDLERGKKVILKSGSIVKALRATMSYPGLFSPVLVNGRWLVDGGVVDPVPVGVARAMGAGIIIAVDLNSGIVSHSNPTGPPAIPETKELATPDSVKKQYDLIEKLTGFYEKLEESVTQKNNNNISQERPSSSPPDIIETIMTSIGIMEERITRMNLAVDSPDILIQPRLGELKMMNFDQVEHAINEGYIGAKEKLEDIQTLLATM